MTPNYQIKAQDFRRWLDKQPDDREWDYGNVNDCVVCSFLKETNAAVIAHASSDMFYLDDYRSSPIPIPNWLIQALSHRDYLPGRTGPLIIAAKLKQAMSTP